MKRVTLGDIDLSHDKSGELKKATDAAREWHRRYLAGERGISLILLSGDNGTGKTTIANACLWAEYFSHGDTPLAPMGRFFLAGDLIARLEGETKPWNEINGARIIVIDDISHIERIEYVAAVDQQKAIHSRFRRIIDFCSERGVSVIITGNCPINSLPSIIGNAAWSRLFQMAPPRLRVDMGNKVPDYRKAGGSK